MTQDTWPLIVDQARAPRSLAGWRTVIGEIAEQLAAERLGASRQNTGNGEQVVNMHGELQIYCADLKHPQLGSFEVKSVGKSGGVIVYSVRLEKDREYARTRTLSYVLVWHRVTLPQPSAFEARELMKTAQIYVIPFCIMDAVCVTVRPRILNKNYKPANGWCQRGYERGGYMVRARALIEAFPSGRIQ